jgi:hypothetical protein
VAEALNESNFLILGLCTFEYTDEDIDSIISAFFKVWAGFGISCEY